MAGYDEAHFRHFRNETEEHLVTVLGEAIGYGRVMQLAEQIWRDKAEVKGGEHTVGPCAAMLVPCPHIERGEPGYKCDICCGCGRVTKWVHEQATRAAVVAEAASEVGQAIAALKSHVAEHPLPFGTAPVTADSILEEMVASGEFRMFGSGTQALPGNPVSRAMSEASPSFAAFVDARSVIEFVLRRVR